MSQDPNERDPGFAVDKPTGVVVSDLDDRIDVYGPSDAERTGQPTEAGPDLGNSIDSSSTREDGGKVAEVKDSAVGAGQHVAEVAKDQAGNVAAEAKTQAENFLAQGRDQVKQQAADQQARVAEGLHSLARELGSMASASAERGLATDLAREASERAHSWGTWLDSREPGQLLEEVKSFARRRPAAFLGLAAAAGIVAGRMARGLTEGEPARAPQLTDPTSHPADPILGQY